MKGAFCGNKEQIYDNLWNSIELYCPHTVDKCHAKTIKLTLEHKTYSRANY